MLNMLRLRLSTNAPKVLRRNIGIVAPALQKATDPIQKLFLDKIREYKSKSAPGQLVDPTPEVEAERKSELQKLASQFGISSGENVTEFPKFSFPEPTVEITKGGK